jgi:hypothetical protein
MEALRPSDNLSRPRADSPLEGNRRRRFSLTFGSKCFCNRPTLLPSSWKNSRQWLLFCNSTPSKVSLLHDQSCCLNRASTAARARSTNFRGTSTRRNICRRYRMLVQRFSLLKSTSHLSREWKHGSRKCTSTTIRVGLQPRPGSSTVLFFLLATPISRCRKGKTTLLISVGPNSCLFRVSILNHSTREGHQREEICRLKRDHWRCQLSSLGITPTSIIEDRIPHRSKCIICTKKERGGSSLTKTGPSWAINLGRARCGSLSLSQGN